MSKIRKKDTMTVSRWDSPLRYTVDSEEYGPTVVYLVDLGALPHPVCTCRDHECRASPMIRQGQSWKTVCCKHVRKVLDHLFWEYVEVLIDLYRTQEGEE
jgi:hypothetical protein